ncbi:MAG: tetratricopeptide repeat protein [Treponema sp.]|nr:tetratricopeptide repeat protein [Candidatus Treponema equifaecale]
MKLWGLHNRKVVKRKGEFVKKFFIFFLTVLTISVVLFFVQRLVTSKIHNGNSIFSMRANWKEYNYRACYDISSEYLYNRPFNCTALTYHGYSAFYLAVSQNDLSQAQAMLDESIISLRTAIQYAKKSSLSQLYYMLGKAYFYKNLQSAYYYYADLAVEYLTKSRTLGYKSDDIPELLGLSYASLGMTMESISAFTEALLVKESDILLLSIAEQYKNAGQIQAAQQYLYRISQSCKDEQIILKNHLLQGEIYLDLGRYEEAENEFNLILEKNENSTDALYGLGVIYENQGDLVKARSEWRKALRIQSNHPGALKKMADYK